MAPGIAADVATELSDDVSSKLKLSQDPLYLLPDDEKYEQYRTGRVFSSNKYDRYPNAIARPTSIDQVIQAVKYAKDKNLQIGVRSGGHYFSAPSVRDNSILIDLQNLNEISFDPATEIVSASPSTTGRVMNDTLSPLGYWFPGGHCADVALGGFLSQGGAGFMWRSVGWAASLIEWMDVVTADGELLHVDYTENTDLLWSFVGSGPGYFAVVVRMGLKCMKLYKHSYRTDLMIPAAYYDDVMKWSLDIGETLAPCTEFMFTSVRRYKFLPPPEGETPEDPEEVALFLSCTSWSNSLTACHAALKFLEDCPHVDKALIFAKLVPARSVEAEYEAQKKIGPNGRYYITNGWFSGDHTKVTGMLKEAFTTLPSIDTYSMMYSCQPDIAQHHFANDISSGTYVLSYAIAADYEDTSSALDEKCINWSNSVWAKIDEQSAKSELSGDSSEPRTKGYYTGDCNMELRSGRFMSEKNWVKWCGIRDKYDPTHRFVGYLKGSKQNINMNAWETAPANRCV